LPAARLGLPGGGQASLTGINIAPVATVRMEVAMETVQTDVAIIGAGGGAGRMFPFTTNGAIKTGDGMALAYRAGVPLKDMEFVQYHPTGLPSTGALLTEACRGEGVVPLNRNGRRFLQDYGMGPETPLGKPVLETMAKGKPV